MADGHYGQCGLSAHQSVTLVSKQESDSAIHPPHSMRAATAPGLTSRLETATPTPARVLHHVFLLLKLWKAMGKYV